MNHSTKVVIGVVLVVIAIGVVSFAVSRLKSGPEAPASVTGITMAKIDADSGQVIERTLAEWQKLGEKNGRFKHPDTGQYTMCPITLCPKCGAQAPGVVLPPPGSKEKPPLSADLKCPKCGAALDPFGAAPGRK